MQTKTTILSGLAGSDDALARVQSSLLSCSMVADCAVLLRPLTVNPLLHEPVAYVVASGPFLPERLHSYLQSRLSECDLPAAYVPLSSLPLTAAGEVDAEALSRLEVIDTGLVRRWEEELKAIGDIAEAAVVVQEGTASAPPLHLSEVLPPWPVSGVRKSGPENPEAGISSAEAKPGAGSDARESGPIRTLSLSDGLPLRLAADAPKTLSEALLRAVKATPENGLIYIQSDGTLLTQSYPELLADAERILCGLRGLGLKPGEKVLFQLEHNQDFIPAFWGCVLGGFVPVPVSIAPTYDQLNSTVSKLHNAWNMLQKPVILTGKDLEASVRSLSDLLQTEAMRVVTVETLRASERDRAWHASEPDDMAIMLLTSGSTGMPKGVIQRHSSLLSRSAASARHTDLGPEDTVLNWFPMDHVGGIVMFHLQGLYVACQQVHAPTEYVLRDPLRWLDMVESCRITFTWAPNFAYGLINAQAEELARRKWDLSSLRFILNAGEAIVARTIRRFLELLIPHGLPSTAMRPSWGMSETCSAVTYSDRFTLDRTSDNDAFVEVGYPIPGFSMRIVDAQGQLVEEGKTGRLEVKGLPVTIGYYHNPELNTEVFTEDGWFNTGDLAMLREGRLTITGRQKDVIIINGINFYSHEIESVVEEVVGVDVSFTAACAVRASGSDTDELALFFHTPEREDVELVRLLKEIRGRVVRNVGVNPKYLIPVERSSIPKTQIGKIQRSQLRDRFEAGDFAEILKQVDILSGSANTLPDWFYRPVWRRKAAVPVDLDTVAARRTLVFVDNPGLGDALCDRLIAEAAGADAAHRASHSFACIRVEAGSDFSRLSGTHYRINPSDPSHYHSLMKAAIAAGGPVEQIVHLWTYDTVAGEPSTVDELEHAQERGLYSLLFLVQAIAEVQGPEHPVRLLVVSSHTQATRPDDLLACERTPLLGPVNAVSQEMPYLICTHLDLQTPGPPSDLSSDDLSSAEGGSGRKGDARVESLRTELAQTIDHEVAYRDGHRLVVRLERVDLVHAPKQDVPFKPGGMYLLTGGLGGIGVEVAQHLLSHYNARLLLIGRAPLSERLQAYQSLRSLGGEVRYVAVDVGDLEAMRSVVARAEEEWGCGLDGVLHLAGLYQVGLVVEETRESLSAAIRPKLGGSWTAAQLVKERPGSVFIGFSSTTGFFGQAMFGAYAAGNRYLDSLCHALQYQEGIRSFCFGWSAWSEIGMNRTQPGEDPIRTTGRGFQSLSAEQGVNSLLAGLYAGQSHLLVGLDGSNSYIRRHCDLSGAAVRAQQLCAYFTTSDASLFAGRDALKIPTVTDRFGTVSTCKLIRIPEIPRTEAGEVDRAQLVHRDRKKKSEREERVAPRTPVEDWLVETWQTYLGISPIGVTDDFFELGGHSLLATQVISRIRTAFQIELPLRTLFQAPTISALAARITEVREVDASASPSLVRVSREGLLPLSFAQQRLWFLDQFGPGSAVYNVPTGLRLTGALDVGALEGSLQEIVRRHEALRTTFKVIDSDPAQFIGVSVGSLDRVDLSSFAGQARDAEACRMIQEEAQRPFDLVTGPLFRTTLLQLGEDDHILLLTLHHIVSDGWSMGVLMQELQTFYNAFCAGKPSPLPELPVQYADYALWQRGWLQGEALERQLGYWKEQLQGTPALLELPTDRPRPVAQTFQGAIERSELPADLTQRLKALGQHEGATLFMTLLAAFQILLSRYCSQHDIVVGTPIANRTQTEVEGLIGFFANTLALRGDLSGNPSFKELLSRTRETALGAYAHQDLPFEKLVDELQPERSLSHSPICQVVFVLQNAPYEKPDLEGVETELIAREGVTAKFDLVLEILQSSGKLDVCLEYNTDLFDAARIKGLLQHFRTLLEGIVAHPEQRISRLPLLCEQERHQLLGHAGPTRSVPTPTRCLHELFEEQAQRTPETIALSCEDQSLTYRQLNQQANQLAHCLRQQGVTPDTLVGLCLPRCIEMVVGVLGILKAGGAYVPLDPSYPQERLAFMLQDAGLGVVVTKTDALANLPPSNAHLLCLDDEATRAQRRCDNLASAANPENLAYLIYTSGSTGTPKGVMITHQNVTRLMAATQSWFHFDERDVWTLFHSLAFDFSVWEIWGALLSGGKMVVVPYLVSRSPQELLALLVGEGVTILNQTPSAFRQLLACLPSKDAASSGTGQELAIRKVIFGGEALEPTSLARWYEVLGEADARLINMYGITETTVHVTYREMGYEDVVQGRGSLIGSAIPDLRLYVLDGSYQPVPVGVVGEIYVGGAGLARGYLGRPELTADRFVPDPFSGELGGRLYRSGDLARHLWNGELEYLGRADDQVKIRGFRIELGEIESVLLTHPGVREAVVLAREDEAHSLRLAAYIVGQERGATTGELRDYLRGQLPEYMVPSAFVMLGSLPLTPNGKVDRKALPTPEAGTDIEREMVAPRTPIEAELAAIWCVVLHLRQVGIHDDFFELGGHSLLATQVISRVRETFQTDIPLRVLFGLPTIAGLASTIEQARVEAGQEQEEDLARLLAELEDLSDAEALALLEENDDSPRELSAANSGIKQNVESER